MFIILTYPRTGSSHLVRLLDSHPDCVCIGEALKPNPHTIAHPDLSFIEFLFQRYGESTLSKFFISSLYKFIVRLNTKNLFLYPDHCAEKLVDLYMCWLEKKNRGYQYGMKIHIGHLNMFPTAKNLLSGSKIILLKRTNILKCYISLLRANQTKVFATSKAIRKTPVRIDTTFLIRDLREIKKNIEYLDAFDSHSGHTYQITYENMINNWSAVKNRLLVFLDLKINGVELLSPFKKIAFGKVENDIQNFDEVKHALKHTDFEVFINP